MNMGWHFIIVVLALSVVVFVLFNILLALFFRRCPHCNHFLRYKGFHISKDGSEYWLYYCPHCGRYDKVTSEELNMDKELN